MDNSMNPTLIIYLEILHVRDSKINWTGFSTSFECIIYHELLPHTNIDIYRILFAYQIYHNYFRPHEASKEKTPSEEDFNTKHNSN
jgi:hypothetical protein